MFFARKARLTKAGEAPIVLRITVNGANASLTTPIKINPKFWNVDTGSAIGKGRNAQEVNQHLDAIKSRIIQIHRQLEVDGNDFGPQTIIDLYLGKNPNEKPQIMLVEVFREHNDRCHKLSGKDMSPATVERYETSLKHTIDFMEHTYKKSDIPIEEVNHKFITDYEFYLKTERNCSHNTATKYLKNFKKIIRIALANEYITKDPFANIKFSLNEVDIDFLTEEELQALCSKEFAVERLSQVRDFFVFACFTGLAFSDLHGLRKEHIVKDNMERLWIRKKRQKTKNMCNIPLMSVPLSIIDKYSEHPKVATTDCVLPIISNTKMNAYLKEIIDVCGITKQVSTHTARHTYATTVCLANGASIENVAKMLGHSNTNMTRHYAKVLDKSIMNDIDFIEKKMNVVYDKDKKKKIS